MLVKLENNLTSVLSKFYYINFLLFFTCYHLITLTNYTGTSRGWGILPVKSFGKWRLDLRYREKQVSTLFFLARRHKTLITRLILIIKISFHLTQILQLQNQGFRSGLLRAIPVSYLSPTVNFFLPWSFERLQAIS